MRQRTNPNYGSRRTHRSSPGHGERRWHGRRTERQSPGVPTLKTLWRRQTSSFIPRMSELWRSRPKARATAIPRTASPVAQPHLKPDNAAAYVAALHFSHGAECTPGEGEIAGEEEPSKRRSGGRTRARKGCAARTASPSSAARSS
jgi:hypothetical protein